MFEANQLGFPAAAAGTRAGRLALAATDIENADLALEPVEVDQHPALTGAQRPSM